MTSDASLQSAVSIGRDRFLLLRPRISAATFCCWMPWSGHSGLTTLTGGEPEGADTGELFWGVDVASSELRDSVRDCNTRYNKLYLMSVYMRIDNISSS